jgi:hypothetical protein
MADNVLSLDLIDGFLGEKSSGVNSGVYNVVYKLRFLT